MSFSQSLEKRTYNPKTHIPLRIDVVDSMTSNLADYDLLTVKYTALQDSAYRLFGSLVDLEEELKAKEVRFVKQVNEKWFYKRADSSCEATGKKKDLINERLTDQVKRLSRAKRFGLSVLWGAAMPFEASPRPKQVIAVGLSYTFLRF